VINYVRDNAMVVTINGEDLPEWIGDGLLGVDVMFDEMSYREMEFALKELMKADGNRVATLREILLADEKSKKREVSAEEKTTRTNTSFLNESQQDALDKILCTEDVGFI